MISVIIPTYKNKELLVKNLRNNLLFLHDCQIIIVNDDPTKSVKNDLKEFKDIILIENKTNLGFGMSINKGVKIAKGDYLMLLNNDVVLTNNNYLLTVNDFRNNPLLFAISFAQQEKDGSIVGRNTLYFEKGFFKHKKNTNQISGPNSWAEGGSCLIDKKKFLKLRGFDKVYSPFYWEDIDLSYRAKKLGYQIIFDRKIEVIHHHESTIGKYYNKNKIMTIAFRNQLIFTWKNLTDIKKVIEHLYYLIPTIFKGGSSFFSGFVEALFLLPKIVNPPTKHE